MPRAHHNHAFQKTFFWTCFFLLLIELASQILWRARDRYFPKKPEAVIYDVKYGHVNNPNYSEEISADLFRISPEVPRSALKDPKTKRIFVIGDSIIFGTTYDFGDYCPIERTIPYLVQQELQAKFPNQKWLVVNSGITGFSMFQLPVYLRDHIAPFQPDLVIVMLGWNDIISGSGLSYSSEQALYPVPKGELEPLGLIRLAHALGNLFSLVDVPKPAATLFQFHEESFQNFKTGLHQATQIAKNHHLKLAFTNLPTVVSTKPMTEGELKKARHAEYRNLVPRFDHEIATTAKANGFAMAENLFPVTENAKEQFFRDWSHPNELGKERFVAVLTDLILKNVEH